jgi:poly(3-hydroxyalkanoate) synthetase
MATIRRPVVDVSGPTVKSATLLNTLVDFSEPGALGHFVDETTDFLLHLSPPSDVDC